jgi:hypothetical protein
LLTQLPSRFPPDTKEKQKKVGEFFSNSANAPQTVAAALPGYLKSLEAANPTIRSWAILGVRSPWPLVVWDPPAELDSNLH